MQRKPSHFGSYCQSSPNGISSTDRASIGGSGGLSFKAMMHSKRCHPEAGEARRGTSQALNRYRVTPPLHRQFPPVLICVTESPTGRSLVVCATRDDTGRNANENSFRISSRLELRRALSFSHGARDGNVGELGAIEGAAEQKSTAAHVAASDKIGGETKSVSEMFEEHVDVFGGRDAAEKNGFALFPRGFPW